MLFRAAESVAPSRAIVEIGSHHGRSTIILASAGPDDVPFVAIDPYDDRRWGGGSPGLAAFEANLMSCGLRDRVELIRSYGADVGSSWDGLPVGLLFIDGAHDYRSVSTELVTWLPHLSPDATVVMHDAFLTTGVTRAIFRHMFLNREFACTGHARSMVRFERRAGSRTLGRLRMLSRLPWFARNLCIKYARRRRWDRLERLLGSERGLPLA